MNSRISQTVSVLFLIENAFGILLWVSKKNEKKFLWKYKLAIQDTSSSKCKCSSHWKAIDFIVIKVSLFCFEEQLHELT